METSKIHLDIMKDFHQRFGSNSLQTLAAILVAIGWMMSADPVSSGFVKEVEFKVYGSLIVGVIWLIHIIVSFGIKSILINQSKILEGLEEINIDAYGVYLIQNAHFYLNLLMNSLLFSLLLWLLLQQ